MSINRLDDSDRPKLGFARVVVERFAFLAGYGFVTTEVLPTIVRFTKGDLGVSVYHGRRSFEIDLEVHHEGEKFSMSELIRLIDPVAADRYRPWCATSREGVESGVAVLADLLEQHAKQALSDDPGHFAALAGQRRAWSKSYALEVLASQMRPAAEEAFRAGRYAEAAGLYEQIASALTPAERAKLEFANQRR